MDFGMPTLIENRYYLSQCFKYGQCMDKGNTRRM